MKNQGLIFLIPAIYLLLLSSCSQREISFNTEIRPLLNEHCVSCHGGVKRSGGFGLVFRENALGVTDNEKIGIVPGKPQQSEMYLRITHHDPEMRMPLDEAPLNKKDIELVKTWIAQGAEWENHWAYKLPEKPSLPDLESDWIRNDIDHFILAKIQLKSLTPSLVADRHTLARRLCLDIIGIPPTSAQLKHFLEDKSDKAYENLVDTLLSSPHYGEHWASMWLDLARYADSFGYSSDLDRVIWKYRDWVIQALNEDQPFDQFTIEQLAGDLLPNPTTDQLIATAFHRNSMTNGEGGADHEEFRNAAVIDRINTTWETWQATTLGCVQCHNHPYDPIKQTDFYRAFAFFNNTSDRNLIAEYPLLKTFDEAEEIQLKKIKDWIVQHGSALEARQVERLVRTHEPKIVPADFSEKTNVKHLNRVGDDYMSVYDSSIIKIAAVDLDGIDKIYLNYQQSTSEEGKIVVKEDNSDEPILGEALLKPTKGMELLPIPITKIVPKVDLVFIFTSNQADFTCLIDGFLFGPTLPGAEEDNYISIQYLLDDLMKAPAKVTTPILLEKPAAYHRKTNVFERGNWLTPGEEVQPGIAKVFDKNNGQFNNRLDLAKWLVSSENPLTARVMVNRIWARIFGKGIVQTVEDFGAMGDKPSHPELLDWLALTFSGTQKWQLKKLIKTIVMSATYRQSSKLDPIVLEKDPDNVWLARSPRVRLSAEQVRDQALQVAGLLSSKMYGPSVMPVQPEGIWKVAFSNASWKTSEGEDLYRRAVYTYIKRSAPYPSFISFDATSREVCLSRRITTNTPLQALVTLNDPVYFEAAKALAKKILAIDGPIKIRLSKAYSMVMGKAPSEGKLEVLVKLYDETKRYYENNPSEVINMAPSETIEYALFTIVANSLMNMDEFIVKG